MSLEIEIEYYNELRSELLKEHGEGKFVIIKQRELLGVFETNDEAYEAGFKAYGFVSFLLRPIRKVEPILVMRMVPGRYIYPDQ